jgi:hypothetical protein
MFLFIRNLEYGWTILMCKNVTDMNCIYQRTVDSSTPTLRRNLNEHRYIKSTAVRKEH